MGLFGLIATLVVLLHLAFVLFAAFGAMLAFRWSWIPYLHVPSVVWATYIELSGGVCPLTPLENRMRVAAGLGEYSGDFVARYLFPVLYPVGLTREAQIGIGVLVLLMNVVLYVAVYRQRGRIVAG